MLIGVAGCVAQAEGERDHAPRSPPSIWSSARRPITVCRTCWRSVRGGEEVVETEFAVEDKFEHLPQPRAPQVDQRGVTAFLTVQEGCDKFCTFCVVPYTRGAEVSRPVAQILAEAERLADAGVREVTLLGQNVNAWHGEGGNGAEWGAWPAAVSGWPRFRALTRLRYTTSHPRDMDDELIAAHRDLPAADALPASARAGGIRPHPQGDEPQAHGRRIISTLHRQASARPARYRPVRRFHRRLPRRDRSGFRGDAWNWCAQVNYASAFSFKYSPRPGTPAAEMPDQVPEKVKDERLQRLQALLVKQQQDFNRSLRRQRPSTC